MPERRPLPEDERGAEGLPDSEGMPDEGDAIRRGGGATLRAELEGKLLATGGAGSDELGSTIAASGDTILVGAPYDKKIEFRTVREREAA